MLTRNPATKQLVLSVLDQAPISEGATGADALKNSVDLAQLCDRLGYRRYWVAEHTARRCCLRQSRGADRADRGDDRRASTSAAAA